MSGPATAEKVDPGNGKPKTGNRTNRTSQRSRVHGKEKPFHWKLKTVPKQPRTLEDVLREGRGKPSPFQNWSLMVDRQVDKAIGKPGVPKERQKARDHVLAQDRSYWM